MKKVPSAYVQERREWIKIMTNGRISGIHEPKKFDEEDEKGQNPQNVLPLYCLNEKHLVRCKATLEKRGAEADDGELYHFSPPTPLHIVAGTREHRLRILIVSKKTTSSVAAHRRTLAAEKIFAVAV